MKTPLTLLWSVLRGDKYMVDAYPPPADTAAVVDVDAAEGDARDASSSKER